MMAASRKRVHAFERLARTAVKAKRNPSTVPAETDERGQDEAVPEGLALVRIAENTDAHW